MTNEQLGQRLYEAYCRSSDHKNFRGEPVPKWENLPKAIRRHWEITAGEACAVLCSTANHIEHATHIGAACAVRLAIAGYAAANESLSAAHDEIDEIRRRTGLTR